ncbi:hypothetical protein V5O48_004419 [Marasmius crinis-equi]|uniref:Mediator of RNA polymerase II transcription subunit 13 n=1 Tax=Marasmius crinis-equi TaxID=585013 RepID=A0ABR3FQ36_9AGAR
MVLNIDDDGLLAAELDVPSVAYAVYTSASTSAIQTARSKLLQLDAENGLQSSFISTVQVTAAAASLYVFRLPQCVEDVEISLKMLREIVADGAQLKEDPGVLKPGYLYPCSDECSYLPPCPNCLNPASTSSAPPPPSTSPASRLPRRPWRDVWAKFLDAVRERIIADVVKRSTSTGRTVNRLKDGFLLGQVPSKLSGTMNEWAAGWESRVKTRSLIYTHLHLHLSGETLTIHPTLSPTPFVPLSNLIPRNASPGESLQQGTPITLLPYATPAHFLSSYNGPTSSLTKQFREALQGCGTMPLDTKSTYIIAWIPVENANGEEKGLTVIYPTELCVGFVPAPGTIPLHSLAFRSANAPPSSTNTPTSAVPPSTLNSFTQSFTTAGPWTAFGRTLLPTIPALPGPLQPSPTVQHMHPPGSALSAHTAVAAMSPGAAHFGRDMLSTATSYMPTPPTSGAAATSFTSAYSAIHGQPTSSTIPASPYVSTQPPPVTHVVSTSHTPLYATPASIPPAEKHAYALSRVLSYSFKELQQSQQDVANGTAPIQTNLPDQPDIQRLLKSAQGIGGYIDAVAKDREKERERMRLGGTKAASNDQGSSQGPPKPQVPILNQQPVPYPPITQAPTYPHSIPSPQQPLPQQQQQTFYPSPPDPQSSGHAYVPSAVSPTVQAADVKQQDDTEMTTSTVQATSAPEASNTNEVKEEEMADDEDLFGASPGASPLPESPPTITEDVPVEPTTDPPDPAPVAVAVAVPVKQKSEPSDSLWGDLMEPDIMGWGFDIDSMDMGSGMGMDIDMFGFGTSSSSTSMDIKPTQAVMRPPPPPPAQSSTSQGASSVASAARSTPVVTKSNAFDDDITDDDFNWFDTHDSGSGAGNTFLGLGGSTSMTPTGSLDSGATLFSSISPSHSSATPTQPTHSGSDPYTSAHPGGMHPPPVPHHAFSFAPSPASTASPWSHPPHQIAAAGTPNTPSVPSDMFPLSPPEEGGGIGMTMAVGTPLTAGTPQTPTTSTGGATARWGAGWGVQLESPFSSPERRHATIREVRKDGDSAVDGRRLSLFDPIPFAASHRVADSKYVCGKFMMPSPPMDGDPEDGPGYFSIEKDETETSTGLTPYLKGLRVQYNTKTDPRIGTVKQLRVRGVKRKRGGSDNGTGSRVVTPAWVKTWEADWKETRPLRKDARPLSPAPSDQGSEGDSDDDQDSDDEDPYDWTGTSTPISDFSRPTTPLPHYVPMGPSLLPTHFHHAHLLPLSSPLRNRDSPHEDTHMSVVGGSGAAASVPTPVSPAAMMGVASEKSKSLEAAAKMVAREVVENDVWGLAWRTNSCFGKGATTNKQWAEPGMTLDSLAAVGLGLEMGQQDVSVADVKLVKELLNGAVSLQGPLKLKDIFESEPSDFSPLASAASKSRSVSPLDPPLVSVGKGDTVIDIMPTGLRFWEKLGLGPKHGEKSATAFVLFEDHGEWRQHQVKVWLSNLATLYRGKNLGDLIPGPNSQGEQEKDGLVPLRFDSSFRKTLASFVASLPTPQSSFVFFIVVPTAAMSLSSPVLRQVFFAVKKAIKNYSEAQILFQFIPEELLLGNMDPSSPDDLGTTRLCCSLYNRILQPVERVMSRPLFEHTLRVRDFFQEPAVTLSRPSSDTKVTYVNSARTSLGVMDRHTLLHVGYQVSHCKKWILAACIDQRGESHDLKVWLSQPPDSERDDMVSEVEVVRKVWSFAIQFAERADVEWRIVFAKLGLLSPAELDAWNARLVTSLSDRRRTPFHVSVVSVDTSSPWFILPSRPAFTSTPTAPATTVKAPPLNRSISMPSKLPSKNGNSQLFVDGTTTTYALFYKAPLSFSAIPTLESVGITSSIVADDSSAATRDEERPQASSLLPLCSATLVRNSSSPTVSASTSSTTSRMLDVHLMHAAGSRGSTYPLTSRSSASRNSSAAPTPAASGSTPVEATSIKAIHQSLLRDIVHSYYSLSVLSSSRMQLTGVNNLLPFHLGAVEAMRNALSIGRGSMDGYD